MLGVVVALPTTLGFVIWRSYRTEAARAERGEVVAHPGALRWRPDETDAETRRERE
jgi:hypothetical protein